MSDEPEEGWLWQDHDDAVLSLLARLFSLDGNEPERRRAAAWLASYDESPASSKSWQETIRRHGLRSLGLPAQPSAYPTAAGRGAVPALSQWADLNLRRDEIMMQYHQDVAQQAAAWRSVFGQVPFASGASAGGYWNGHVAPPAPRDYWGR
jgi:hypothetical protein